MYPVPQMSPLVYLKCNLCYTLCNHFVPKCNHFVPKCNRFVPKCNLLCNWLSPLCPLSCVTNFELCPYLVSTTLLTCVSFKHPHVMVPIYYVATLGDAAWSQHYRWTRMLHLSGYCPFVFEKNDSIFSESIHTSNVIDGFNFDLIP
jgi:hypothetical protein